MVKEVIAKLDDEVGTGDLILKLEVAAPPRLPLQPLPHRPLPRPSRRQPPRLLQRQLRLLHRLRSPPRRLLAATPRSMLVLPCVCWPVSSASTWARSPRPVRTAVS